jgi:hypothetical protein
VGQGSKGRYCPVLWQRGGGADKEDIRRVPHRSNGLYPTVDSLVKGAVAIKMRTESGVDRHSTVGFLAD